jgi:hypothetical protein
MEPFTPPGAAPAQSGRRAHTRGQPGSRRRLQPHGRRPVSHGGQRATPELPTQTTDVRVVRPACPANGAGRSAARQNAAQQNAAQQTLAWQTLAWQNPRRGTQPGTAQGPTKRRLTDAGPTEPSPGRALAAERSPTDAGPTDAGPTDAGPTDAGPTKRCPADAGSAERSPQNAARHSAGPAEPSPRRTLTAQNARPAERTGGGAAASPAASPVASSARWAAGPPDQGRHGRPSSLPLRRRPLGGRWRRRIRRAEGGRPARRLATVRSAADEAAEAGVACRLPWSARRPMAPPNQESRGRPSSLPPRHRPLSGR